MAEMKLACPMKTYEVLEDFHKLSWKSQVIVLTEALDYMSQYNGRSKRECIALAMGYKTYDGEAWNKE